MLLLFLRDLSDPLINDAHDTAIHSPLQPLEYNTKTVDVISWHFSLHWIKKNLALFIAVYSRRPIHSGASLFIYIGASSSSFFSVDSFTSRWAWRNKNEQSSEHVYRIPKYFLW